MSLQSTTEFKGLTLNDTVYKIIGFSCLEKTQDKKGNKTYELNLNVKCYTDNSRKFELSQDIYTFDTDLSGLNIENGYNLLKSLDKFKESIDL